MIITKIIQSFVSEPTVSGRYQISKYNVMKDCYSPIKGEIYLEEETAKDRARYLNEIEHKELKEDYEDLINTLSSDFGTWEIKETVESYNALKENERILSSEDGKLLIASNRKIITWNKRVNEVIELYNYLNSKEVKGLTPPYKYVIKGFTQ